MQKRWIPKTPADRILFESLKKEIQTSDILLSLIAQRNLQSLQEAHSYFVPSLEHLHSPFLMKDMDTAVERIHQAVVNKEKIVIYGDYDVDGTTAVALVYSFLRQFYHHLLYYIPDRFKEGYGISRTGIDWAKEREVKLIIALDCGIKSVDNVAYAAQAGIDFIICDHHTAGETIPAATAVLNPKRPDCPYPFKELSGCGIGYKLVEAYATTYGINWHPEKYLELVAVSIASDIVHMTGENRILTYFGLEQINSNPSPGVKALIKLSGLRKILDVNDLVFRIGPRINAAGRVASGTRAVEMLVEESEENAMGMATGVHKNNTDRQTMDQLTTKQALEMIEKNNLSDRKTTVLFNPEWHKGVIGIVASRLIEKYYRPTILLTESNGYAVGSARSVRGYDLYSAIQQCGDLLEQWGGHIAAAGLTLKLEKINEFAAQFEEAVSTSITPEQLTPAIEYDLEIPFSALTLAFAKSIDRFGPFGPENMRPMFVTRGVRNAGYPKIVGNNHLQLKIADEFGNRHHAIAFGMGELKNAIPKEKAYDICYNVGLEEFRGNWNLSLNIKDIRWEA